jgi:hypothetical protein
MGQVAKIRRRRKGSRLQKRLTAVAALGIAGCAMLLALSVLDWAPAPERAVPAVAATAPAVLAPASLAVPVAASRKARRVYPYSIIPGGVSDRADLARMVASDKVVATHYASLDVNKMRELTVTRPRAVYVSYRKGDKVYWTAKKLMLAEGETLLSDGSSEVRTRCGNRISDVPQLPVEAKGPTSEELDSAVEEVQDAPVQAGLTLAESGIDAIGDMPSLAGHAPRLPTLLNGASLWQASSAPPSHDDKRELLAMAESLGASPVTVVGGGSAGSGSTGGPSATSSPASGSTGSPGAVSGPVSGSTGKPVGSGDPAPGSTPDMPTVLAPSPTQAVGTVSTSDTQMSPNNSTLPIPPTGPVSTMPDTGTIVPPSIPPELLSPTPIRPRTGQASTKPTAVPEPSTLWLSGVAFAAMLLRRRKARHNAV